MWKAFLGDVWPSLQTFAVIDKVGEMGRDGAKKCRSFVERIERKLDTVRLPQSLSQRGGLDAEGSQKTPSPYAESALTPNSQASVKLDQKLARLAGPAEYRTPITPAPSLRAPSMVAEVEAEAAGAALLNLADPTGEGDTQERFGAHVPAAAAAAAGAGDDEALPVAGRWFEAVEAAPFTPVVDQTAGTSGGPWLQPGERVMAMSELRRSADGAPRIYTSRGWVSVLLLDSRVVLLDLATGRPPAAALRTPPAEEPVAAPLPPPTSATARGDFVDFHDFFGDSPKESADVAKQPPPPLPPPQPQPQPGQAEVGFLIDVG
jgi:hypothetical protein